MTDLPASGSDGDGKLMAEYLVLDIVTITDPPVAEDDSYCLADAHIVRVSDLGRETDDHKKLLVRTHLGRLLKPGDYALGYDVAGAVILVPSSQGLPTQLSSPQQIHGQLNGIGQQQGILLNIQQLRLDMQKNINQQLVRLHKLEQEILGSLPTTSDPQGHEGSILVLKQTRQHLTRLLSSSLQREMDSRLQGPGSLLQDHNAIEQKPSIQYYWPVVGSSEDRSKWGYLLKL